MNLGERLMKEYELIIGIINRLGISAITIKGWTITLIVAVVSLRRGILNNKSLIILLISIGILWLRL